MPLTTVTGSMITPSTTLSGDVTVTGTMVMGSSFMRNRIINGDMRIDQRNAGASLTITNNGQYNLDRWSIGSSQSSKLSIQQNAGSVTPPAGFTNYAGITSLAATTVGSDAYSFRQQIEGYNIADLDWGTANAKSITVSFWVRSSLTGAFGASIFNSAANRVYPFSYTISSANTWTQISVTVPGDTTGTWLTTNGTGLYLYFGLGVSSSLSGTANVWNAGTAFVPTSSTNVVSTNGATWYITGVQLEQNTSATPFERRLYGQELANCQRYYQKLGSFGGINAALASGVNYNTTTSILYCKFTTTMRAAPTGSVTTVGNFGILSGGVQLTCTSLTPYTMGTDSTRIDTLVASGLTTGQAAVLYLNSTTDGIQLNAEL